MITIIIVLVAFGVGMMFGKTTAPACNLQSEDNAVSEQQVNTIETQDNGNETATRVDSSNLTPAQRTMLKAFGINPDEMVITEEMKLCAEARLGAERMVEIQNGATPSMTEGMDLVACYK